MTSFPGYVAVAADVDRGWLDSWTGDGGLGAPLSPSFLCALEEILRLEAGSIDAVVLAPPLDGDPPMELTPLDAGTHPRLVRARRYRTGVRAWSCGPAILVIGRGLAGRWEVAVEVDEPARNRGLGRSLARAARHLVPDGRPLWAQVAPGNAASLRAFLAAGYTPVGAEVLLLPREFPGAVAAVP
ncbi:GNAT family N-acetyltransferase [Pseudosporangium ferrugineum]|uniref:GNAT family N-acetyltransferase n=1 Tax=Pseudosporangium ferrugineum TaxID=439699 RepID=UPI001FE466B8|nr:GNAT family N-acetyltransferase [Pseudosporangium ferrugineum]